MNRTHGDFTSSKPNPFEDPKVRFRHHSLMQDYQELHMETEAMRKRLQTIRERKTILMAEVRFLRRRYRHLRQYHQPLMQPENATKNDKGRSNGGKKIVCRNDADTKHVSLPDLNHSGRVQDETKTSVKRRVPLFDLNQISGEEEDTEVAVNNDHKRMRLEESSSCKKMRNIEIQQQQQQQQQKEMKLSSCRNGENESNKRKISWQDPVAALRV